MNRRQLVLAGGTVAFTAIGAVKRYQRRPRRSSVPPELRAVVAVPIAVAVTGTHLYGWDIGEFAGGIWGFFSDITEGIKDFVWAAIDKAVSWVLDVVHLADEAFDRFHSLVTGTFEWMGNKVANVAAAVGGLVVETTNRVEGAFSNFRQQVKDLFETAWDPVKNWVTDHIPDWIKDVLGDAWDLVDMLWDIGRGGLALLADFVRDPIGFVWDLISGLVDDAINAANDVIGIGVELFEQIVRQGLAIIFAGYGDIIEVLQKCFDVLLWVADHIDDFTTESLELILNPSWQSIQQNIVETVDENISDFEGLVRKVFGLVDVQ